MYKMPLPDFSNVLKKKDEAIPIPAVSTYGYAQTVNTPPHSKDKKTICMPGVRKDTRQFY